MRDVVLISIDDLFSVSHFRNAFGVTIQTPNLDRLAAQGVSFENAFAATALCNPSRTSVMTSQSPFETGVHWNNDLWYKHVDPRDTLPAQFQSAGYESYGFGKLFHGFSLPADVRQPMFDRYYSAPAEAYFVESGPYGIGTWTRPESQLGDHITTRAAIQALNGYNGADPLLMMVGLVDPHSPMVSTAKYKNLYPLDEITMPPWKGDEPSPFVQQFLASAALQDMTERGYLEKFIQGYLANITEMDTRLGELLDAVDGSGRDPVIALYSDHGYSLGDHDTLHKFNLWDQAGRAPLIIVDPTAPQAGRTYDGVVSLMDLAPTLLDLAGLPIPGHMQGRSLADVIQQPSASVPGVAVTTMFGSVSLRTNIWRYTRYEDGSRELFHIPSDPDNSDNLADQARFASVIGDLDRQLRGELAEVGATYDDVRKIVTQADGADTLYFVNQHSIDLDRVSDAGGIDTVRTSQGRFTLPDWAENFVADSQDGTIFVGNDKGNDVLGGFGGDKFYGLAGSDTISGLNGNDLIDGGVGNDFMDGAEGNDIVRGGAGDDALQGGTENDRVEGQDGADIVRGYRGDDTLLGGAGNDTLEGEDGDDYLAGGLGTDVLAGGRGADMYVLDSLGDRVIEAADGGVDTVVSMTSYNLAATLENLVLRGAGNLSGTGHDGVNRLTGNAGDNVLSGKGGSDVIDGGRGDDILLGGTGARDALSGGAGLDFASYAEATSRVVAKLAQASSNAGEAAGDSYVGIEGLIGSAFDDILLGDGADNVLDGGGGNDAMAGAAGSDLYFVSQADDRIVESADVGVDGVRSSVSFDLAGQHLERLTLLGFGNLFASGNELNNTIVGNGGDNNLNGRAGNDKMVGGAGRDSFLFNTALVSANRDVILDFSVANDTIRLDNSVFRGLPNGPLGADAFVTGPEATAASHRIIYNRSTGALSFDADGSGAGDAIQFGSLSIGLLLTWQDFTVV